MHISAKPGMGGESPPHPLQEGRSGHKSRRHHIPRQVMIASTIVILLACMVSAVTADGSPVLPHNFYGNVTINGVPAPNGTVVTAEVQGGGGSFTTTVPGKYGSTCGVCTRLLVMGEIENGAEITFSVNGVQAECYPVPGGPWQAAYPFQQGASTELHLRTVGPVHFIQATTGPGGDIDPSGSVQVAEGSDRTFTISPDACYEIDDVFVNAVSVGPVPSYTFFNVTENQTIHATFSEDIYTITATAHQGGSISPSGVQEVDCGDDFAFTVSPDAGYTIDNVFLDATPLGPVSGYTIYDVSQDHVINAYFTPVVYTISASAGPNGNISPVGDIPVSHGDDQTFLMLPDTGYTVGTVIVDGETQPGSPTSFTFYNVDGDHTISVTFVEGPPEYFTTTLGDGWNLFSTPIELAPGHREFDEIFPPAEFQNIEAILGWDGSEWFIPVSGYQLKSRYSFYVKVDGTATAHLYPLNDIPHPLANRPLPAGWNLVGPQPFYQNGTFPTIPVEDDLISVYWGTGDVTGYTMVVSPGINQPFWIYYRDGSSEDLLPYKGYWVYMQNPGQLAGYFNPVS